LLDSFVVTMLRLLELERRAEVEGTERLQAALSAAELERRGLTLLRLAVVEESAGPGGRVLVALERTRGDELPAHRFQPGDIAALRSLRAPQRSEDAAAPPGVVYRVTSRRVTIALDEPPEESLEAPLRLDRVANDVTYRRMRAALDGLREAFVGRARGPAARLREVAFRLREPVFDAVPPPVPLDPRLDASQREAVAHALGAREFALIHGPPGTGKTTAVVEVIRQSVARREKVLACAPSNIAVDNLVERLAAAGLRVVRLGHPARLLPSVLEHSLDALIERAQGTRIASGVEREIESLGRRLRKTSDWSLRRELRAELRRLRDELREITERTVRDILASADAVLATNTAAGDAILGDGGFDLVVLDEASQAIEAASWIPLLKGRRAVLAGDHCQLPPTVISQEAQREGLGVTLFERLAELAPAASRLLTVQYRMHERIMSWSSEEFYGGRLEAHDSVRGHVLADLPHVTETPATREPLFFVDTAGADLEEDREAEGDSLFNEGEAAIAAAHVTALLDAGVRGEEIGVVTPYNAQVNLLRSKLGAHRGLEISTVDGFQGREKEAIVLSLVRSNPRGEVGFLADERRLNVAVTRARRHAALIADSATVSAHPFLARLLAHFEKGVHRSAWEYR
jgi:superfamily I DNA and/or RNA helicase